MTHLGDITRISGYGIAPVDVAVGGSPCQDASIAGQRKGLSGKRSGLYMEQIRVIKELRNADFLRGRTGQLIRPRFMVWENVPGFFSVNQCRDFLAVLEEAARIAQPDAVIPEPPGRKWHTSGCILGDGWSIAWRVLDAQFWGVPQRRRRIALVADFGGLAAPEILFVRKSVCGDIDQSPAPGERSAAGVESGADETGRNCLTPWDTQSARVHSADGIWHSLNANENGGQSRDAVFCPEIAHALRAKANLNFREDGDTLICAAFMGGQGVKAGGIGYAEEVSPTLKAVMSGGNTVPCVYENHGQDSRLTGPLDVAPTVARKFGTGGNNTPLVAHTLKAKGGLDHRADSDTLIVSGLDCRNGTENREISATLQAHSDGGYSLNCPHPVRIGQTVRRLTPLECERLQNFPDGWTDIGPWVDSKGKTHKESSDSARYKALGNSIALPPWAWVMKRIAACYERSATMGSFFDGIGGFPLIWERLNGTGSCLWASEIEEFPMEVTKRRFDAEKEMERR